VQSIDDDPEGVVSGYAPDLRWSTVIDGAILVRRGLPWIASNTDATVPTPHGPGPGNGVLVRAVAEFADREPDVAGKPRAPLLEETLRRVGGERPLVVGDRLDTDIEGAVAVGCASLLVMTGVTGLPELVAAPRGSRPSHVAATLGALLEPHPLPRPDPDEDGRRWSLGGWVGGVDAGGALEVTGDGSAHDWWRVVSTAAWTWLDATGEVAGAEGLAAPAT
jgi:hypothetical protein